MYCNQIKLREEGGREGKGRSVGGRFVGSATRHRRQQWDGGDAPICTLWQQTAAAGQIDLRRRRRRMGFYFIFCSVNGGVIIIVLILQRRGKKKINQSASKDCSGPHTPFRFKETKTDPQ